MTVEIGPHLTTALITIAVIWLLLSAYRLGGRR